MLASSSKDAHKNRFVSKFWIVFAFHFEEALFGKEKSNATWYRSGGSSGQMYMVHSHLLFLIKLENIGNNNDHEWNKEGAP